MMTVRVRVGESGSRATGVAVVALWERHPEHPGGEVFLAGGGVFEVALTPAVEARLRDGRLILVEAASVDASVGDAIVEKAAEPPQPARPRKSAAARKGGL